MKQIKLTEQTWYNGRNRPAGDTLLVDDTFAEVKVNAGQAIYTDSPRNMRTK